MRSFKLSVAVAAAALLTVLAPAGALAAGGHHHVKRFAPLRPRPARAAGCRVQLVADPHQVTSGEKAELLGALSCPPRNTTSAISQPVTIYEHSAGSGGFRVVATTATVPGGFFSFVPPPITTNSVFYAVVGGARSPSRAVNAAPVVTLEGPKATALVTGVHNAVTFSGRVSPADAGAEVVLQREEATASEEWDVIGLGAVRGNGTSSTYSITHVFARPGAAEIRVVVRRHGGLARGISNSLSYVISQRENPALTINASSDPIAEGGSATLSGVLAGGGGQKVTLWSRSVGVSTFAKVTELPTTGGGEYNYTQTLLHTAVYKVTAGSVSSAQLFEGVKYALTAGDGSVTTIPARQPLTFSGTVTPAAVGKVVYLERQNAFGGGYHVADVGVVGAGGAYTITHLAFGPGTDVFRVHVPGDRENLGTSSGPFTVTVTPAPPGPLRPLREPRQPSEGKV